MHNYMWTTTTVLRPFVWDYLGKPVPEETFTHSYLSWSSTILYQLPLSTTINNILHVQFTCFTVFLYTLYPSPLWSTSWSGTLHFILHLHINLTILMSNSWSATTISFLTGHVSLLCNILHHIQLLYSVPLTINDIFILVSNGTKCLNLFQAENQ